MTPREDRQGELERLMQRALCELPLRRAPATLERRVTETIEHSDARKSGGLRRHGFGSWPVVARAALIASCLASVLVVILGLKPLAIGLAALPADASIAGRLHTLREAADVAAALGALLVRLVQRIPPAWLFSALFATALVYGMLFALVAVGYSTFFSTPERSRS